MMRAHPGSGSAPRVAIVGGGWAGCAAAMHLADKGAAATLYEQAPHLGGRARSVAINDLLLDNGQHLLIGAYTATLDAIARVHGGSLAHLFHDLPLTIHPFGSCASLSLSAADLPAPWHLASAMLTARGLTLMDRWSLVREMKNIAREDASPSDTTVRTRFAHLPRAVYGGLWEPLCLAALNTPPARASARIFTSVLRSVLHGPAGASRFLVPRVGLSELLPDAAARFVLERGGGVMTGERVRSIMLAHDGVGLTTSSGRQSYDHVIIAVGPHQLSQIEVEGVVQWPRLRNDVASLHYESINTIHLGYTHAEMECVIERLDDTPGQWVFDGGTISASGESLRRLSVVISGNGAHDALAQPALIDAADAQLRRCSGALGELRFAKVFAERRATFACEPGLVRPQAGCIAPRLHLAGDYTHPDLPATLESAVQTAIIAADGVLAALELAPERADAAVA